MRLTAYASYRLKAFISPHYEKMTQGRLKTFKVLKHWNYISNNFSYLSLMLGCFCFKVCWMSEYIMQLNNQKLDAQGCQLLCSGIHTIPRDA